MVPMRRKERLLEEKDSYKILEENNFCHLAFVGEDGYPQSLPLNYLLFEGKIIFHGALEGHKARVFKEETPASITVVETNDFKPKEFTTKYKSVMAFGTVRILEGEEKDRVHKIFTEKLSENYTSQEAMDKYFDQINKYTNVYSLDIKEISGKSNIKK